MSDQPWRLRISHQGSDGVLVTHPGGQLRLEGSQAVAGEILVQTGLSGRVQIPDGVQSLSYRLPAGRVRAGQEAHAVGIEVSGGKLLYLGHALHPDTPADWVGGAIDALGTADWLLVGVPEDGGPAVLRHLPAFGAGQIIVLDLRPPPRRNRGPVARISTWVDQAKLAGLPVMGVAPQVSVRFE